MKRICKGCYETSKNLELIIDDVSCGTRRIDFEIRDVSIECSVRARYKCVTWQLTEKNSHKVVDNFNTKGEIVKFINNLEAWELSNYLEVNEHNPEIYKKVK
jgi:hypothetical protein